MGFEKGNKYSEKWTLDKVKDYYNFGGIRLEDDILITADGCRLLGSKRLPIGVQEVENELIK